MLKHLFSDCFLNFSQCFYLLWFGLLVKDFPDLINVLRQFYFFFWCHLFILIITPNFSVSSFVLTKVTCSQWRFQKHGIGIVFEEKKSGKIIDVHRGIISNIKAFDSWRLSEYFESSNCSKVIWKLNTFSVDDDDLDKLLKLLKQANIVKLVSNQYKLYELVR